jgi:osmotically-inducible protein OsmY
MDPKEMSMTDRRSRNAEKRMNIANLAPLWCAGFVLIGALSGCATFEKCGFKGCSGDAQVTAEVKTLSDRHPELGTSIHVQTLDRVVYLYGLVDTPLGSEIAESVALEAPGVTHAMNSIAYGNN